MEQTPSENIGTLTIEPGEEVVDSIKRAAQAAGRAVSFVGAGEIEDAELLVLGPITGATTAGRTHRKLRGPADLVSLIGHVDGGQIELRAMVAREGEAGCVVAGGLLVRATAVSVRLVLSGASTGVARQASSADVPRQATSVEVEPTPPVFAPVAPTQMSMVSPPLPPKPGRPSEQPDFYPEENDVVTHFAFGRCVVLVSDGERLRLQQERDGRVREVALSMLRIQPATTLEDGRKHWDLARKN